MQVEKDEFFIPEVRKWSLEKYRLVGGFCDIFTTGMKNLWNQLVYIDLYAGAGFAKIKETGKVYKSSSLIALSLPIPFTKYIFCEKDPYCFSALKSRIARDFSGINITLINKDSNLAINDVLSAIPPFGINNTQLPFCFVDPYSLDFDFNTIRTIGNKRLMDFLILQALHMDANRNLIKYLKEKNDKIACYLGMDKWREDFKLDYKGYSNNFVKFLAEQYQKQMVNMGYLNERNMHQIRSNERNLPLYYLSFYSKHPRGLQFFKEVEKRTTAQLRLEI